MPTKVEIVHEDSGAEGTAFARAVPYWLERGYKVKDDAAYEEAKKADGITADDEVKLAELAPEFNPTAHGAKEVHEHLAGLDRSTGEGQAEYDRIVAAEQAGKNRPSAIPA